MIRTGELVFVDTGAWIALALTRDPLHPRAAETWEMLLSTGARLHTSVPVVLETFTFLDRNARRDVALTWKTSLKTVPRLRVLPCTAPDLEQAWKHFERPDLHKLSAVDALTFVLMAHRRIRVAFAFDGHFATAGFRMVG
jgi:predicted nucleic acid-binding protein